MTQLASSKSCLLVIPARRRSTRLPDKMLLRETGKTVLQHTFEAACQTRRPARIVIATDDLEIAQTARRFGAEVVMTRVDCPSGTDRVAEVVRQTPEAEIIVNLQGDEPEIDPRAIDQLFDMLLKNPAASMATLATPIHQREPLFDPACVKVVFNESNEALYFSRSPIPHVRDWEESLLDKTPALFYQHIGVYAYRRELLLKFAALPPSPLEQLERLEQLRVLHHGERIMVWPVEHVSRGIDTAEDYAAFVSRRKAG